MERNFLVDVNTVIAELSARKEQFNEGCINLDEFQFTTRAVIALCLSDYPELGIKIED